MKYVNYTGPDDAEILIIGESPGGEEVKYGQPFVGQSGELLRQVLHSTGFDCASADECKQYGPEVNNKYKIRFANLVNHQPNGNRFDSLTEGEVQHGIRELNEYISRRKSGIKLCITLGSQPLQYIAEKYGIDRWRGSVITVDGLTILPTYHPAYILRSRSDYPVFAFDIGKAYKIYREGYKLPKFNFTIDPAGYEVEEILHEIKSAGVCAVDIETVKYTNRIICCGFATSKERAVCLVNRSADGLEPEFRRFLSTVLEDEGIKKIFHNGLFDVEILNNNQIPTKNFLFDTMIAQHVLQPELPKGLDFITSIYTDIPYYKDRGRMALPENEKGWGKLKDEEKLTVYEYNCLDCVSTFWCYKEMEKEICEDDCFRLIFPQEMEMHAVAFELTRNGMLVDIERRDKIKDIAEKRFIEDQRMLDAIVGSSVNVGSPQQKKKLLYETWKLPEKTNKDQKTSTDEDAIVSLISYTKDYLSGLRTEEKRLEWKKKLAGLMIILKLQGYRKLLGSYINIDIHPDGRVRSSYKITGAETGRWSCSKYFDNTGVNAQTMPREIIEQ